MARSARFADDAEPAMKRSDSAPSRPASAPGPSLTGIVMAPKVGASFARNRSTAGSVFDSVNYLARQNAKRLETRRNNCVESTKYREAAKINSELDAILQEHEEIESNKIELKRAQEQLKLIRRQAEELQQFNATWSTKMRDFAKRTEFLRADFSKEQTDANKQHLRQVRSEKPQLKFSKQLAHLRNQAQSLAALSKFDEAEFVKNEANRYEAAEVRRHTAQCDHVSRSGGKEWFTKGQKNARENFEARIEMEWMRLNVAKRRETDQLLKRQANQRSRFFEKQKKDKPEIPPLILKE